ncbi:MAG: radical SAM protein [Clostridiales bacterium]|nr:radical SAM protein [Clostridiales bacterium]
MDEIKEQNVNLQNPQGQNQGGGGKRRRRKKRKGGGGQNGQNAQNQQAQQVVEQAAQQERAKPQPQQQKQKQKQKQNKQADDGRKDTYAYVLDGNLYINLTNKCSNGCDFCVRNERASYYGHYLWLRHGEPTVDKVIAAVKQLGDLSQFKEVVFCGFGEPTYKVAEMVELCDYFHEKGLKTRLNTNGQGNLINKRDIVPEIKGKIDFVNVSLNASCAEKYQKICRSQFKEMGFDALVEFAKICRRNGVKCRFSIVDCIGEEEVEACKKLAESVKVPLYIRKYITDS